MKNGGRYEPNRVIIHNRAPFEATVTPLDGLAPRSLGHRENDSQGPLVRLVGAMAAATAPSTAMALITFTSSSQTEELSLSAASA